MFVLVHTSRAGDDKQIKLEDIEQDTLTNEEKAQEPEQELKEIQQQQPTHHIQLSYSNEPQDVYVTPQPRYNSKGEILLYFLKSGEFEISLFQQKKNFLANRKLNETDQKSTPV